MKVNTDSKKITELLARGVEETIDKDNLRKKLEQLKDRIELFLD